eukprot:421212-Amphidinium_carterae.1
MSDCNIHLRLVAATPDFAYNEIRPKEGPGSLLYECYSPDIYDMPPLPDWAAFCHTLIEVDNFPEHVAVNPDTPHDQLRLRLRIRRMVEMQLIEYAMDILKDRKAAGGSYRYLQKLLIEAAADSASMGRYIIESLTFLNNFSTDQD